MAEKPDVEESSEYENFVGKKETLPKNSNLYDVLGIEDEDESVEWKKHWVGMPEFEQEENPPFKKLIVSFATEKDYLDFQEKIGQTLTHKTKTIWHPKLSNIKNSLMRWIEDD